MSSEASRISIIGAGVIARHHAAAVALLPDGDRIGLRVADPSPEARAGFLAEYPDAHCVADAAELLAEPARLDDIVIVATPPFTHRSLTLLGLASGRHVLCEKPLAMDAAEATEMLAAARAAGRHLGCCSSRFLGVPATERTRDLVEQGTLGALYHATFVTRTQRARTGIEYQRAKPWFLDRSRSGGGTLMDWSPYDIAVLNHVLRPVRVEVSGAWMANPTTELDLPEGTVFDTEQHVGATLRLTRADGQQVTVAFERAACTHGAERQIAEIEGIEGAVRWDWIDWAGDGRVTVTRDDHGAAAETIEHPTGDVPADVHVRPLLAFAALIRGEPNLAIVDEQAVFNFHCLQAIYASARTGTTRTVELAAI